MVRLGGEPESGNFQDRTGQSGGGFGLGGGGGGLTRVTTMGGGVNGGSTGPMRDRPRNSATSAPAMIRKTPDRTARRLQRGRRAPDREKSLTATEKSSSASASWRAWP